MRRPLVRRLESLAALRRYAPAWHELWSRSDSTRPTARAEHLALWCECFAPDRSFLAVVVEDDGQAVAALPLVRGRVWRLPAWTSPGNAWSPAGELLLAGDGDVARACQALFDGLRALSPGLVALDGLLLQTTAASELIQHVQDGRLSHVWQHRFRVPWVEIDGDWPSYFASRGYNHRRHMRAVARRAERDGGATLVRHDALAPGHVEPLLRACFEIEAAGWKGRARSAVLHVPAAWQFFRRQAEALAASGELAVSTLEHRGRSIAFEYGWNCRGVRGVLKVGYDESCARLSPGQLLRYRLLEQLFAEGSARWIDYVGPASAATAAWATRARDVGRMVWASGGCVACAAVWGYRLAGPLVRRLRGAAPCEEFLPCENHGRGTSDGGSSNVEEQMPAHS